jgi:hypothetical protein
MRERKRGCITARIADVRGVPCRFLADCAPVISLALSPAYAQDGRLWVGTEAHGLFYSEDRGESWEQMGLTGSVNTILVNPRYPEQPDLLALVDEALFISRDDGQGWRELAVSAELPGSIRTVIAPTGLNVGSPLLLGIDEGIVVTTISS